jgi:hypothetical protein
MEDKNERFENTGHLYDWMLAFKEILNGQEVPCFSEIKYLGLGVTLDKRLTFASHTAKSIKMAEMAF